MDGTNFKLKYKAAVLVFGRAHPGPCRGKARLPASSCPTVSRGKFEITGCGARNVTTDAIVAAGLTVAEYDTFVQTTIDNFHLAFPTSRFTMLFAPASADYLAVQLGNEAV